MLAFHFSGEARLINAHCEFVGTYLLISWFLQLANTDSSVSSSTPANPALLPGISNHLNSDFVILPDEWPSHVQPTATDNSTSRFSVSVLLESTTFSPSISCFVFVFFQDSVKMKVIKFLSVSLSAPSLLIGPRWPASLGSPAQICVPSLFSQLPNVPSPGRSYLRVKKKKKKKNLG